MSKKSIDDVIAWVKERTAMGQPLHEISELVAMLEEAAGKKPEAAPGPPAPKAPPPKAAPPVAKKK